MTGRDGISLENKKQTSPNLCGPQTRAQFKTKNKPSNLQHKAGVGRGEITSARTSARSGASAKGTQNKPLNGLLEHTSSLEEAPDARGPFRRVPNVYFYSKDFK